MDSGLVVLLVPFATISVLGALRWRAVMNGERDLYDRVGGFWVSSDAGRRAYAPCFPIMVLMVWFMTRHSRRSGPAA